ncbi:class E sortase [Streptomyces djakartensis]|uniref:Class E sortase n=1 Tax=Streptomyces djakartensis TaxID=68193 RepID=A0ABQ3A143_9ACTN|nr:class E sortase [Streptomyces djakartensis]GGY29032.1 class E sortase [Streptomyces djakartensis]
MTALRPERESDTSYGQQSYGVPGALEDWSGDGAYGAAAQPGAYPSGAVAGVYAPVPEPYAQPHSVSYEGLPGEPVRGEPYPPPVDEETVALRIPDPPPAGGDALSGSPASSAARGDGPAHGGRAARRKAAKRRHGRHGGAPDAGLSQERGAPLSRVEARRQARARRPGPAVVVSRAIGEVFITTGVLMLLFVTYQLWWTNVRAHAQAGSEASSLQDDWASGKRAPGAFEPGQGFAILHIPKLDVVVPIAEGTSNKGVLDRGMVGHYAEGALKTAMPGDKTGNFGLAGHRNTHGEPFRYINKLSPGDPIVVETQDEYYVYKMASILPVTPPSNTSVLNPVPQGSGFTKPGRYITLTTCTPEFTSKYRMIVWGKMVEERPRSKGKPDALVS